MQNKKRPLEVNRSYLDDTTPHCRRATPNAGGAVGWPTAKVLYHTFVFQTNISNRGTNITTSNGLACRRLRTFANDKKYVRPIRVSIAPRAIAWSNQKISKKTKTKH